MKNEVYGCEKVLAHRDAYKEAYESWKQELNKL